MEKTQVFFFLGQSGAGKGTQVAKVLEWLKKEAGKDVLYVSMGDEVRGTISKLSEDNFFRNHMHQINEQGKLQPPEIPLYFFLNKFIFDFKPGQVIIIDGSPRSEKEFSLWQDLISSGYIPSPYIINIEVSDEECKRRLKNRPGRSDTQNEKSLNTKLAWYTPVRKILADKTIGEKPARFAIINIDGEKSAELVFEQVKKEINSILFSSN